MNTDVRLTRWNKTVLPEDQELRHALRSEGLGVLAWTDTPGTIYPVHTHPFAQARVVLHGRLRIGLPETGEEIVLGPGDRLDLPPETPHWEEVHGSRAAIYLSGTCTGPREPELPDSSARLSRRSGPN